MYSTRELASLSSLCVDAVMLHKRKCLIIAEEKKQQKTKNAFVLSVAYLSPSVVMDDSLGVECVCVFVYRSGAK